MSGKTKNGFANTPGSSAAERMWKEISAYLTELNQLPSDDARVREMIGELHLLAEPPADRLLRPVDIAFLVIGEKMDILCKRFLSPGPLKNREGEFEVLERTALALTMSLHVEVLNSARLLAKEAANRETRLEADAILYHYRLWVVHARDTAIEALRTCAPAARPWVKRLVRGKAEASDRATRLAQVSLMSFRKSGLLGSSDKLLAAIKAALRMHEAYKPAALCEAEEMLGKNKEADAGRWSLTLEKKVGFENLVWLDGNHELVPSPTQAKDGFDALFDRWHEEKKELPSGSLDQPVSGVGEEEGASLHDLIGMGKESDVLGLVEMSLARDAAAGVGIGDLLKEVLDSIDAVAPNQPKAALSTAAEVIRLVALIQSEPEPGTKAGILYAWARGDLYRGALSPEAVGKAFGVAEKTVRRREAAGRARLVAAGIPEPEENPSG